jgi:hypothetical protein
MENRLKGFGRKFTSVAVLLCMLLSIFAPTVMATTEGAYVASESTGGKTASNNSATEKKDLVYVSIGDSMTNGYGIDGYSGDNGILNYGTNTYANKFAAWLAGYEGEIKDDQVIFTGKNGVVDHRQLAMSGMRPEDIRWLLELD